MMRTAAVSMFCAMAVSAAAHADVINYAEPADLSGFISAPTPLPMFDIGVNTVSGHLDHHAGDNSDAFLISLPSGASLSSVTLTISNFTLQDAIGNWGAVFDTGATATAGDGLNSSGNLTFPISFVKPGSLSCFMFASTAGAADSAGTPFGAFSAYDYTWSFTVVPAPGAAGLLGLAGFAATRRRR